MGEVWRWLRRCDGQTWKICALHVNAEGVGSGWPCKRSFRNLNMRPLSLVTKAWLKSSGVTPCRSGVHTACSTSSMHEAPENSASVLAMSLRATVRCKAVRPSWCMRVYTPAMSTPTRYIHANDMIYNYQCARPHTPQPLTRRTTRLCHLPRLDVNNAASSLVQCSSTQEHHPLGHDGWRIPLRLGLRPQRLW